MKDNEIDYLDKLFASSSDATDEAEVAFPLVDAPDVLSEKLYAIAESAPSVVVREPEVIVKHGFFEGWPTMASVAASLFVAIMGFQFYQQQQTLKRLEQAQADLATALHYLGEANRITRAQVLDSLSDKLNEAEVLPAIKKQRESETRPTIKPSSRTL